MDARVILARGEHHRGIVASLHHVVIGGIRPQPLELLRVFARAVFRHPEPGHQELVVTEHVQEWNGADRRRPEFGSLRDRDAGEQAAIGPAHDDQLCRGGQAVLEQCFGARVEVVIDVLLRFQHPRPMPRLAEFAAAAKIRDHVDPARIVEGEVRRDEPRGHRDVEAAVAVEERRMGTTGVEVLAMDDEHRDLRAVLRGRVNAADDDRLGVDGRLGSGPDRAERSRHHIAFVDRARFVVARVTHEGPGRVGVGRDAGGTQSG